MTAYLDEIQQESVVIAAFKATFSALRTVGESIAHGVRVLFLRPGNSISVLLMCEDRSGLNNLVNLYAFGQLSSILEALFTRLLVTDDPMTTPVHIRNVVWELSDYGRCYVYFNPLPRRKLYICDQLTILLEILCFLCCVLNDQ